MTVQQAVSFTQGFPQQQHRFIFGIILFLYFGNDSIWKTEKKTVQKEEEEKL